MSGNKETSNSADTVTMDELRMAPTSDSPRKAIKSTAVVKYSAVEAPACFEQLRCNTDLNEPPSNWLSTQSSGGIHHGLSTTSGFSSFRMAHMFPDCVGEVDVVSDAENIKKLLKIPYSKGPVSMMVHRVENTLLIDEFDVHKHLLRAAESEWIWLRKFFFEHVLTSLSCKNKGLYQKNTSRIALQQRSLVSKFLYHTINEGGLLQTESPQTKPPSSYSSSVHWSSLPEPRLELPDHKSNHEFARNVVWTFEDIQMLIGTDMPIFGGTTHPCISLRLRDMKRPISVLTGIDYWLDNLMCNVPEVVMCYHLDGIVQKYELVKTEDLPHLEDSKFSPKLIHDVAQNILSFLKSNATKSGHTYWLFKGKDDDAVKLYDLTSLCTEEMQEKEHNPFTVPVAMLIYRVARNMKQQGSKELGCIRMLLEHCISLLDKEKYPQIVTSAHYMLSDLYVPADTEPGSPQFPTDEGGEVEEEGEEEKVKGELECTGETSVEVQSLYCTNPCTTLPDIKCGNRPPPLCDRTIDRCKNSLKHISEGLNCLRLLDTRMWHKDNEKTTSEKNEDGPKMAHPFTAIPMPYAPISKEPAMTVKPKKEEENKDDIEDKKADKAGHLLTLLYDKTSLVLAVIALDSIVTVNLGTALRHIRYVLKISLGLEKLSDLLGIKHGKSAEVAAMRSFLLGKAGDVCCLIVQNFTKVEQYREELKVTDPAVEYVLQQLALDIGNEEDEWPVDDELASMLEVLHSSIQCYNQAINSRPAKDQVESLHRRMGNVHNELGVLYMSQASNKFQEGDAAREVFHVLVKKSLSELEAGIAAFESIDDTSNHALLLTNCGRLMRMCAHVLTPVNRTPLEGQERYYYNRALCYYQRALSTIGSRKNNPSIWDTVTWELSTALFSMAVILQDVPNSAEKGQDELEKETVDCLQKALQSCDLETTGPRQPMYQFRAAAIHHRLASLYHKSFRVQEDSPRRKFALQLCRLHYEKAADMFKNLEDGVEILRVQLERVALCEFLAEAVTSLGSKRKSLHSGLELLLECEEVVAAFAVAPPTFTAGKQEAGEELPLLNLMEQRLQCLLLTLTKLAAAPSKQSKIKETLPPYKAMYALTLHHTDTENEDAAQIASRLCADLQKIAAMLEKCKLNK